MSTVRSSADRSLPFGRPTAGYVVKYAFIFQKSWRHTHTLSNTHHIPCGYLQQDGSFKRFPNPIQKPIDSITDRFPAGAWLRMRKAHGNQNVQPRTKHHRPGPKRDHDGVVRKSPAGFESSLHIAHRPDGSHRAFLLLCPRANASRCCGCTAGCTLHAPFSACTEGALGRPRLAARAPMPGLC